MLLSQQLYDVSMSHVVVTTIVLCINVSCPVRTELCHVKRTCYSLHYRASGTMRDEEIMRRSNITFFKDGYDIVIDAFSYFVKA